MKQKKAQGLSLNVIIIAAMALIVLVVVVSIFLGKAGFFGENTESCEFNGGKCIDAADCTYRLPDFECAEGVCCSIFD